MFTWFNQHKLNYNKGQLTPIFIVVLVILIIMALVTVNLGKVAFIKTDSSNAVDAGALAGGSVMANTFNALAATNQDMYEYHWEIFFPLVSTLFFSAWRDLLRAQSRACPNPCSALSAITRFIRTINNIRWAVRGYWAAQYWWYLAIRGMAEESREEARKIAHQFTFMNSGIGSKLIEGEPPAETSEARQGRNYREEFTNFLDHTIGTGEEYTYDWEDGQERNHEVVSRVSVDELDTFDLITTAATWPGEEFLLGTIIGLASSAVGPLSAACACYNPCRHCCRRHCHAGCPCCGIWATQCAAASTILAQIPIYLGLAWAGLLPELPFTSSSNEDAIPFIICWLADIVHDRRFTVATDQLHSGADLGLWESRYPATHSYSTVDFTGYGNVGPPPLDESDLRHDPSIVETDK